MRFGTEFKCSPYSCLPVFYLAQLTSRTRQKEAPTLGNRLILWVRAGPGKTAQPSLEEGEKMGKMDNDWFIHVFIYRPNVCLALTICQIASTKYYRCYKWFLSRGSEKYVVRSTVGAGRGQVKSQLPRRMDKSWQVNGGRREKRQPRKVVDLRPWDMSSSVQ